MSEQRPPSEFDPDCELCGGEGLVEPEWGDPVLDVPYTCNCGDPAVRAARARATQLPFPDTIPSRKKVNQDDRQCREETQSD